MRSEPELMKHHELEEDGLVNHKVYAQGCLKSIQEEPIDGTDPCSRC